MSDPNGKKAPVEVQDRGLRGLLDRFGVGEVYADGVLAHILARDALVRGWKTALDRAAVRDMDAAMLTWLRSQLPRLADEEATDQTRALAAEVEAGLRLSWIGPATRMKEGKRRTCDFRVGAVNVEVYCPQEHVEERRVVEAALAEGLKGAPGVVKVAMMVSHPTTGSGRKVDKDGRVVRDANSQAARFPTNKLMDRVLSSKRSGAQLPKGGEPNILWLDLKHGMRLSALDCTPLRSSIAKGTCFVGMTGVWQAFYGRARGPLFADRTPLEYALRLATYPQQSDGWFRVVRHASCAVVSVADGLIRLDNPWARVPLDPRTSAALMRLSELRPEFSWFDDRDRTLRLRVAAERRRIAALAQQPS